MHREPQLVKKPDWHQGYRQAGLIFAHAVERIDRKNSIKAAEVWDQHKDKYTIPQYRVDQIERRLALGLAFRRDARAYSRLEKLNKSDQAVREWRVRAALTEQHWPHVAAALDKLDVKEKQQANWQYWRARSYDQDGKHQQALQLFNQLAGDRSFYGFLSAYKLNQEIRIGDRPISVSATEIAELASHKDFQMIEELRAIDRNQEAKRQWWYAVSRLKKMTSWLRQSWLSIGNGIRWLSLPSPRLNIGMM
nr:hypothetical protein [Methylomarinum sp. Ch1-1]MDP4520940.1 hypothetical protein [Methylomarinum sp. Ch1-1]